MQVYAPDWEAAMRCYFRGKTREIKSGDGHNGYVSFTIPDMGITFRAQFNGNQNECE
jgi:hypothetical protein